VHERLVGYDERRVAHVDGSLVVRDCRDSSGAGLRAPGRNLKVLYHRARATGWDVSNRETVYLAAESRTVMPRLAAALLEAYLPRSLWPAEAAWACSMLGEICEDELSLPQASRWYERALDHYPSASACMRLCRSRFREGRHAEAVAAYERGLACLSAPQPLDQSDLLTRTTPVLAAAAMREVGRHSEAVDLCRRTKTAFPTSEAVAELLSQLEAGRRTKS
jgi:tetratricopeptide (TPR) repeat protein